MAIVRGETNEGGESPAWVGFRCVPLIMQPLAVPQQACIFNGVQLLHCQFKRTPALLNNTSYLFASWIPSSA